MAMATANVAAAAAAISERKQRTGEARKAAT
jgi:hypothetical protein